MTFVSGEPVEMRRLSATDPSLAEHQIQELVVDHPEVLPVVELDSFFSPAIAVGREVGTAVGVIDALFVSPDGGLTVVEAKLWRNPQARREVVGQIIDYAAALSSWSYEDLDAVCVEATGTTLWELVSSRAEDHLRDDEAAFIDTVSRNLRQGRFLLLVVGDGIREEVERMATYVQTAPRLQFHLVLVELGIYESEGGRVRTVVPSVVARTAEITRAVVHVEMADEARVEVDVSVPADDSPRSRRKLTMDQYYSELRERTTAATAEFYRDILDGFESDARFDLVRGSSSVSLHLRPEGGGDLTVLVFKTDGHAYTGWIRGQCERAGVPGETGIRFVADLADIVGLAVSDRHADGLAGSVGPAVVRANWAAISERIERLAQEVSDHLE